jgi:hypothetical protein
LTVLEGEGAHEGEACIDGTRGRGQVARERLRDRDLAVFAPRSTVGARRVKSE